MELSESKWKTEPSLQELIFLTITNGAVFFLTVSLFRSFVTVVKTSGDNGAFLLYANAIRTWTFQGLNVKAFWGLPYAMALISTLTRVSDVMALLCVSYISGLLVAFFGHRLWGGLVTGLFLALNFAWIQRLFLGGTEPLFMALICGAFYAARKKRFYLATLIAGLSTTVRPVGIFVLLGIGVALLLQRRFKQFSVAALLGMAIGALYVLPIAIIYKSPFANVLSYQKSDWAGGRLLNWPFVAVIRSSLSSSVPLTNIVLTTTWVVFVAAGLIAILKTEPARNIWRSYPAEMIFAVSYIGFLFTYTSPVWARAEFVRFSIPALPFVLVAFEEWLPKDRRILWLVTLVCSFLAGCSAIGIRNVASYL